MESMAQEHAKASEASAFPKLDIETGGMSEPNMGLVARGHKIGPITLPAYRSPLAQTIMIGFVCFLVVGKSLAISANLLSP